MDTVELVQVEAIHEALQHDPEVVEQARVVPCNVTQEIGEDVNGKEFRCLDLKSGIGPTPCDGGPVLLREGLFEIVELVH